METYRLSSENITIIEDKIHDYLIEKGIDNKEAIRMQFAAEEILLAYQKELGEKAMVEFFLEQRIGASRIILRIPGASFDPFGNISEDDRLMHNLMKDLGSAPVWNYRHSCNEIFFMIGKKKKMSSLSKILIAVAFGIGLGVLMRLFSPDLAINISEKWMAPVQNAIMGLLSTLSALFILLSVTTGICSMGDVSSFNRIGKKLIFSLLLGLMIVTILCAVVLPFLFPLAKGEAEATDISVLWQMIVDIIPTNIIETFSTGNTIQIIFLSIISSLVLLIMGPNAQELIDIIGQLSELVQHLIHYVIELMPIMVFVSMFRMNANGNVNQLLYAYKYPLFVFLLCFVYLVARFFLTVIKYKIPPSVLLKKLTLTFFIALVTSSSSAALQENIKCCEKKLGIDRKVINVGIPLGQTIYMPSVVYILMVACLVFSQIFNVPVTFPSYCILTFSAFIVTIATPPVPGALLATFTLMLSQLGIPYEAMSIIIALDAIIDRIGTCTYITGLQLKLIDIANDLNMLDKEILLKAE